MEPSIHIYGGKTLPVFSVEGGSTATTVTAGFNGLKTTLKGITAAPGKEIALGNAWVDFEKAYLAFLNAYGVGMN